MKYSYEDVKNYFAQYKCILLTPADEYEGVTKKVKFKCECTNEDETTFRTFLRSKSHKCKVCRSKLKSERNKIDFEAVKKTYSDNNCVLLSTTYNGNMDRLEFICSCGKKDKKQFNQFRKTPRCRECSWDSLGDERRKSFEEVKSIFEDYGCVLLSAEYKSCKEKLDYICKNGHNASTSLDGFLSGGGEKGHCKECHTINISGENNYNWNGGSTNEAIRFRKTFEFKSWRTAVFQRDGYACQVCNVKGGTLNAHHLDGYNWCTEKRTDVNNGVTLCKECHDKFHDIYGRGDNTKAQFKDFTNNP
ncbi:HNH endonuclease [Priestia aryabhattai]|uniref:HNH endonuclease n=1 Tax=Priestia aryabhattai TaxID=412384 RepID=UPI0035324D85